MHSILVTYIIPLARPRPGERRIYFPSLSVRAPLNPSLRSLRIRQPCRWSHECPSRSAITQYYPNGSRGAISITSPSRIHTHTRTYTRTPPLFSLFPLRFRFPSGSRAHLDLGLNPEPTRSVDFPPALQFALTYYITQHNAEGFVQGISGGDKHPTEARSAHP